MRKTVVLGCAAILFLAGCECDSHSDGGIEVNFPKAAVSPVYHNGKQVVNVEIYCPGQKTESYISLRRELDFDHNRLSFPDLRTGQKILTTCPAKVSAVTYRQEIREESRPADKAAIIPEGQRIIINNICPGGKVNDSGAFISPDVEEQCGR